MAQPTPPGNGPKRPVSDLASQLKDEIRADVEKGIRDVVRKPAPAPAAQQANEGDGPGAPQRCPGCGGRGTTQQGYSCGACGGTGTIGTY